MYDNDIQRQRHTGMDSQAQLSVLDAYRATLGTLLAADQQLTQNALQGWSYKLSIWLVCSNQLMGMHCVVLWN